MPESTSTTAPAAPAAPAAAATPAPKPSSTPVEISPVDFMADIIGDFEQMAARDQSEDTPATNPSKPDKKASTKPAAKVEDDKEADPTSAIEKPEDKAPEKPADKEAEVQKPAEVKPVKAAELRTAYEGLKKKLREELEPEIQRLRAKVKEYETNPPQDSEPLLKKIKATEERNAELEKRIEFADYRSSRHFQQNFQQPYREAWNNAVSQFNELTVREESGEDELGNPQVKVRKADENDLLRLANLPLSEMDEAATKMFGASSARAISHIENIKKLADAQNKALQEAEQRSAEWLAQQRAETETISKGRAQTWIEVNKALKENFPKAYAPEEGDADDKAGFLKGFALADLMFTGPDALTPEQIEHLPAGFKESVKSKKPLTDAQIVQLHALARLKMANHDRKVAALKKANARIAELEKALKEFEESEPTAGRIGRATAPAAGKDWLESAEDELRALDK